MSRESLLSRIGDINNFQRPRPVVTLEEYFEDNYDRGSIGYNLPNPYTPQEFFAFFRRLRDHPEIIDVLVEVQDLEDPEGWPSTSMIWFVTSLSQAALAKQFEERVRPDEWRTYPPDYAVEPIRPRAGAQIIGAWYD
jgi:hypothetical protein